mgnify:CR=1 FL=1
MYAPFSFDIHDVVISGGDGGTSLDELWSNYDKWVETAVDKGLTLVDVGSTYYHTYI